MADVVLPFLLRRVLENVASPIIQEVGSLWGVDKELNKLSNTLSRIRAVMGDADRRQIKEESMKLWLSELKDVAYDADDIVDEFLFDVLRSKMEGGRSQTGKVMVKVRVFLSPCFHPNQVMFRHNIGRRIKNIRERLDEIAKDRDAFHLRQSDGDGYGMVEIKERPQTSSLIDESNVFGREEDKIKMIEILTSDESIEIDVPSVIPIVGMGGLGKTTLAQLVYNDEGIKDYFEPRMWVCVSENFDVRRVTKAIVESAAKKTPRVMDLDPLQMNLKEILSGKRFLLVLDDVWSENPIEWNVLRAPFNFGARGSKIIVTTRSEKVSMIMGTFPSYCLKDLSDDDCWSLFKRCTSGERSSAENANLEAIGREIVKKCGGLPLAIKTIGSLLSFKMDETEWDLILKSEIWDFPTSMDNILPALRLSYHHLPTHVKQCFVYCSAFPKDYGFEKDKLVQLWMAQGFIQPKGWKQMEDVGSEYFDELLLRSFFGYSHNDWEDRPVYKIHDLIHDLARSIAGDEFFRMENMDSCNIFETARHLSLLSEHGGQLNFQAVNKANRLRTFLFLGATNSLPYITHPPIVVPHDMFRTLSFLHVLDLSYASVKELPSSIGNLKHLRYLNISHACIKRLPDSIARLYNLQTLRLKKCSELIELPKNMSNLINLRHLYMHTRVVNSSPRLISMPPGIGKLTCLRTLSLFVVGRESGRGIEQLKDMRYLRGSICITKLENVVNKEEAMAADLRNKEYLHELELQWSSHNLQEETVEEVFSALQPHVNIRVLGIFQYGGIEFSSWLTDPSFSKLETVYLFNCKKCIILPPLGQLPSLKELYIRGMHEVKQIGPMFCGVNVANRFPSLKTLELEDMPTLEEWFGVKVGDFYCLEELELIDCPMLKGLPYLPPTLTNLLIRNCKELSTLPRLPSLCNLDLNECNESILSDLSLSHLTSLSSMNISGFSSLKSLPEGLLRLTTLKQLHIGDFSELTSLPEGVGLKDLPMLERLSISCCPQLTSLLELGLPITLTSFQITKLDSLRCLPKMLHCLSSLQKLDISHCTQLHSLPEDGLPPSLRNFCILSCPLLKERCGKDGGEDWNKIAQIPYVEIDNQLISRC